MRQPDHAGRLPGSEFAAGELTCSYAAYPNIERWLGNMKALKNWTKAHEAIDGFAASLKDKTFVTI